MTTPGMFWLADHPEHALPGVLDLEPRPATIRIHGELIPWPESTETEQIVQPDGSVLIESTPRPMGPADEAYLVHGVVDLDRPVTAAHAYTTERTRGGPGNRQTLTCSWVIEGGHVSTGTTYSAVRIRIHHLDAWQAQGIEVTREGGALRLVSTVLEVEPVPVPALGPPARIALDGSDVAEDQPDGGVAVRQEHRLLVDQLPRLSLDAVLGRIVRPLAHLVTIAVNAQAPVISLELVQHADPPQPDGVSAPHAPWLTVHHPLIDRSAGTSPSQRHGDQVVRFSDVGLTGLATWLAEAADLDVIPTLLASQVGRPDTSLETPLLILASTAEGYHRRVYKERRRLTPAQTETVRDMVAACETLDDVTRAVVQEQFAQLQEPTFHQRLLDLAADAADAAPGATGTTEAWARRITEHRNRFAHRLQSKPTTADLDEMIALRQSLRWVLGALVLMKAGVTADRLATRHRQHPQYSTFLDLAPRRAPEIYGTPSADGGD